MSTIGVCQGIREALDAEPMITVARRRLADAGLAGGAWIVTHTVRGDAGAHTACGLSVPAAAGVEAQEIADLVAQAFEPHDHEGTSVAPASVWVDQATSGPLEWLPGAEAAAEAQRALVNGRAVVYPGVDSLVGTIPVEAVTAESAIDTVVSMGGPIAEGTLLHTRDHVRPMRLDGRWVLHVQPAVGGTLVPFENAVQHHCCQSH